MIVGLDKRLITRPQMQILSSCVNMVRMTPDTTELFRLILNLIRVGSIAEVDCSTQCVRVNVGGNLTDWRPWVTLRAGEARTWWPPTVGEQVVLLSPEGDLNHSIVLPALYSQSAPPPSTNPAHHTIQYQDGAVLQYDHMAHTLIAVLPRGSHVLLQADNVTVAADNTTCTGNLIVQKNLVVNGLSSLNAGLSVLPRSDGATAIIQGKLTVTEDVNVGGVSLIQHTHPVHAIGADTGAPT